MTVASWLQLAALVVLVVVCTPLLGSYAGTGVGLGLAVARGFVQAMGGELTLDDTPGGGTTALVSLPRPTG